MSIVDDDTSVWIHIRPLGAMYSPSGEPYLSPMMVAPSVGSPGSPANANTSQ